MRNRIQGYDLARAFAIFGMVIVNFKIVMNATTGSHYLLGVASLLEGRAAAIFVILAGVGVSLLTKKARESNNQIQINSHRKSLLKRSLLLIVIGLAYSPIWPADILHFYGFYIIIGAILLTASNRTLLTFSGLFIVGFVFLLGLFDYESGWNWKTYEYLDFWSIEGMVRHMFYNGFHPVFPWAAFLLIGMWLGRQNVLEKAVRNRLLIGSLILLAGTEFSSHLLINYFTSNPNGLTAEDIISLFGTKPMPPVPLYILSATGSAITFIMICINTSLKHNESNILIPLIYTGQLALTFYVGHVIIGMGFLEAIGRLENQTINFALLSAMIFNIICVMFAYYWKGKYAVGPLEWLFRRLAN